MFNSGCQISIENTCRVRNVLGVVFQGVSSRWVCHTCTPTTLPSVLLVSVYMPQGLAVESGLWSYLMFA